MSTEAWLERHKQLLDGNYDEWWPGHTDIRTGNPEFKDRFEPTPTFGKPVWHGEPEPIRLLINADFGMGDTIQFWRFVHLVKSRVSRVYLRCDEDFKTLFKYVDVVGKGEPMPYFDKVIHMMALPKALGIKKADIHGKAYIVPNLDAPMDWALKSTLPYTRFSKIGVCWQGNPFNPRDGLRSMPEAVRNQFFWSFDHGMRFFSLNKIGPTPEGFWDMKSYMGDWNQTAQLIQLLDQVITVDTAVAHLAGALGKPTKLIVPTRDPDWRWGTHGDRTLWYDSVRLYRLKDSWEKTVDELAKDIMKRG